MTKPEPAAVFQGALKAFLQDAQEDGPFGFAAHTAVSCGGGEIGLYTLLGGHYAQGIARNHLDLELLIDHTFPGRRSRPDFQLRRPKSSGETVQCIEFKWLAAAGTGGGAPAATFRAIAQALVRLEELALACPERHYVVFYSFSGSPIAAHLQRFESMGFRKAGQIELPDPNKDRVALPTGLMVFERRLGVANPNAMRSNPRR